jgi:hypothetical protein
MVVLRLEVIEAARASGVGQLLDAFVAFARARLDVARPTPARRGARICQAPG